MSTGESILILAAIVTVLVTLRASWYKQGARDQRLEDCERRIYRMEPIAGKVPPLEDKCNRNFDELGTSWIEMKCRLSELERKIFGKTDRWNSQITFVSGDPPRSTAGASGCPETDALGADEISGA